MSPRPTTPDRKSPDGTTTITVQRACNGCGRDIGDATTVELDCAYMGLPLPDVADECGCTNPVADITIELGSTTAPCPASRPVVYISGPRTGLPAHNYPAFEASARDIAAAGMVPLSPHTIGQHDDWTHADYMRAALRMQLDATHVYMLPGWAASRGAQVEHIVARAVGQIIMGADQ